MSPASKLGASCLHAARTTTRRAVAKPTNTQHPWRAFLSSAATSRPLYLDFLAPNTLKQTQAPSSAYRLIAPKSLAQRTPRRTLTTSSDASAARPAQAIVNPRNDDDGKPMQIGISPRASNRLHAISAGDKNPNLALRVSIESGGCHGFQYLMDLTDLGEKPAAEDDTVFEGAKGEKIVVDESSLELLNGSTVDYTMELIGSQFKITGIPGATSSCGCGTSFDIKL
jgi:iron-sulfur cluster assembly accessory protein